jgi:hypothetical protein
MSERPVTATCQRCAQTFDLLIPEPGSRNLHFNRIESMLRFCGHCGRYVGRTCCWDAATQRCRSCAGSVLGRPDETVAARGELREIDEAIVGLTAVDDLVESLDASLSRADPRAEREPPSADDPLDAWEDAWLETGALISRVESLEDAVAAHAAAPTVGSGIAQQIRGELRRREALYEARRNRLAEHLVGLGAHLQRHDDLPDAGEEQPIAIPIQLRPAELATPSATPRQSTVVRRARLAPVAVLAILVVGAGLAVAALDRVGVPRDPERPAIVPGAPSAAQSAAPGSSVSHEARFDLQRLGPLAADGAEVASVVGPPVVVAYSSSFDRSLLLPVRPSGFCFAGPRLQPGPADVQFDLLLVDAPGAGLIRVELRSGEQSPTSVVIGLAELGVMHADTWYRVQLAWDGSGAAGLRVAERETDTIIHEATLETGTETGRSAFDAACLVLDGPGNGEVLVDNARIAQ